MPYFRNVSAPIFDEAATSGGTGDILFLHIPKTGGTSVENYFYKKYAATLQRNFLTLYGTKHGYNSALHHMTYREIKAAIENGRDNIFKRINLSSPNLVIITIVRNPYHRILSELFSSKRLPIIGNVTSEMVECAIDKYLDYTNAPPRDDNNHRIPQIDFFIDAVTDIERARAEGREHPRLIILQTELLTEQMRDLGFTDFAQIDNRSSPFVREAAISYDDLLTDASHKKIADFYKSDIEFFKHA